MRLLEHGGAAGGARDLSFDEDSESGWEEDGVLADDQVGVVAVSVEAVG
ncbi:hypothetical protein [Streptomyces sp. NPDC020996]